MKIGFRDDPGSIYLIYERDFLTKEFTENVKIGLVRDPKDPIERLGEHQTGNSRELFLGESVHVPSVSAMEANIHSRLATRRLNGEWFYLPGDSLGKAKELVTLLAGQMTALTGDLSRARDLESIESDGGVVSPSAEVLELHHQFKLLSAKKNAIEDRQKKARVAIATYGDGYIGVEGLSLWSTKKPASSYRHSLLKALDEKLYESLLEESLSSRLTISKPRIKPSAAIVKAPENIMEIVEEAEFKTRDSRIEKIHYKYLADMEELAEVSLEIAIVEVRLKLATGTANEIAGVLSWPREMKRKQMPGAGKIVESQNPELYLACIETGKASSSFEVRDYRPYSFRLDH